MKRRMIYLVFPIITLILEILPYGAVCNFANPEGRPWRKTFSYFDLTPFGYANFAPFLTAITTCVIFGFLFFYLITDNRRLIMPTRLLLCVGMGLSLCPLIYGVEFFSVVGALITVSLLVQLVLISATLKVAKK